MKKLVKASKKKESQRKKLDSPTNEATNQDDPN